ncbi:MAG: hypothetical protein CSA66_07340, partial [Proteobacteria bacterium]
MNTLTNRAARMLLTALTAAALVGGACGGDEVAYDRLYLEVSSSAPSGGGTLDGLRILMVGQDDSGARVVYPESLSDPQFNLNLAETGLDPVANPVVIQVQYQNEHFAATKGKVRLSLTGRAGGLPVTAWEGEVDLTAKTLVKAHLTALGDAATCDADGDGFLNCGQDGCCPAGAGDAFADCDDTSAGASPWGTEDACEPCDDALDNDCSG